jgi:hypothetical protein
MKQQEQERQAIIETLKEKEEDYMESYLVSEGCHEAIADAILQRLSELREPEPYNPLLPENREESENNRAKIEELLWVFSSDGTVNPKETIEEIIRLAQGCVQPSENSGQMELEQKIEEVLISHGRVAPKTNHFSVYGLEIRRSAAEIAALFPSRSQEKEVSESCEHEYPTNNTSAWKFCTKCQHREKN